MTIRTLLIANRGEIARRIMRTCRDMGIVTVAVHSDPDADATFVREADLAVSLGGTTPATSYLRIDAVVDAARRAGADAVHPGYGFLSENAAFAQAVVDAGLVWVGPPPAAIAAMGSKLAARARMTAAGVAVVPGADLRGVPDADLPALAATLGLPLLVKASAGGGGRGMRIVHDPAAFAGAVAAARREAAAAFGDDTVFVERYVERPRHIEIQVMADTHGTVVHLFERECSVQRRHQKIIEEAPSPFLSAEQRAAMGDAAVVAARSVGYVGAGTVEFIVAPDGEFFFLEMNGLQVEHPVTEMVTGIDLVRAQLEVAARAALADHVRAPRLHGHTIEARLYAEDPDHDYLPGPGTIRRFDLAAGGPVRVDAGFAAGDVVSAHYDPMLAKVVAHAPTRAEAARVLARALRPRRCVDGVVTNRELLVGVLEHPEFLDGGTDTGFLDRHPPRSLTAGRLDAAAVECAAVAAAFAQQAAARATAPVLAHIPAGFRNNRAVPVRHEYRHGARTLVVEYTTGRGAEIRVDGERRDDLRVRRAAPGHVEVEASGVRLRHDVDDAGEVVHVGTAFGSVSLAVVPRFPVTEVAPVAGSLLAPMPGTVARVDAVVGATVAAGAVLAVLEAMKMEHLVTAPVAGVVEEVRVAVGDAVDAGTVLVVVGERTAPRAAGEAPEEDA